MTEIANYLTEISCFLAYTIVCDEKIFDVEWMLLEEFMESFQLDEDARKKVLAILGDTTDKIALEDVLKLLNKATEKCKEEAVAIAVRIAFSDGYLGNGEKAFLVNAVKKLELSSSFLEKLIEKENKAAKNVDIIEVKAKKRGAGLYSFLSKIAPARIAEKMQERYRECLLSGPDYSDTIKTMHKVASEDIVFARKAIDTLSSGLDSFVNTLNAHTSTISDKFQGIKVKKSEENIGNEMDSLKKELTSLSNEINLEAKDTLKKKEEAVGHYTISFMGRTKAGKSTLHSVILGGINKEFIGKGMERTTRYNRVYQWNGIRIIDTPGIGAPGGKTDTEIARSVIAESDLICYVVTTDSIQETEFNFLAELKKENKPVIILLNKKENFERTQGTREKFLADPLLWYTRKDKDDIQGHIDRITEYVNKHFSNVFLKIYPVQLKAAQLSIVEEDLSLKKKYLEGSRIKCFLDEIRVQVLQSGTIKRSDTILNGTIYRFHNCNQVLSNHYQVLNELSDSLQKNMKEIEMKVKQIGKITEANLNRGIDAVFESFVKNELYKFAQNNYDCEEQELNDKLQKYIEISGFNGKLKNRMDKELNNYKNEVDEILESFKENFEFQLESLGSSFTIGGGGGIIDTRFWVGLLGSIVGLVGFFVAPWLAIAGIVVAFFSSIFDSKEEKIEKAKQSLYNNLCKQFDINRTKIKEQTLSGFLEQHNEVTKTINSKFSSIIHSLNGILIKMKPLLKIISASENDLNKKYAARIMNYCAKRSLFTLEGNASEIIVERDFGKCMTIIHPLAKQLRVSDDEISSVLQEEIVFLTESISNKKHK